MAKFILEYSRSPYMGAICNSVGDVADNIWCVAPYGEGIESLTIVYGAGVSVFCTDLASFYQILDLVSQHYDKVCIFVKDKDED